MPEAERPPTRPVWAPQLLAVGMLALALTDMPYGYYRLLRVVCFVLFALLAWRAATQPRLDLAITFGALAFIYNPLIPLHLGREIWTIVNLVTIAILLVSCLLLRTSTDPTSRT